MVSAVGATGAANTAASYVAPTAMTFPITVVQATASCAAAISNASFSFRLRT
jgi:hypothetical protein